MKIVKKEKEECIIFYYNAYGIEHRMKVSAGLGYTDLCDMFKDFSKALGYHPDTIKRVFGEEEESNDN